MPDQWPRSLVRATLRDAGYDAVGTRTLASAMRIAVAEPDRGAVRLIVVDQAALGANGARLDQLLALHDAPATLLLASATAGTLAGAWQRVLRRPVSVADIATAVAAIVPLAAEGRHALD
jgi:hypothetical protein